MTSHLPPLLAGALLLIAGCSAQPGSHHHGGPAGTTAGVPGAR